MTRPLRAVSPDGVIHRVGRHPDAWAFAPWIYAGPDNTFGNRYDDPAGEYRVLYASSQRRGALLETLARFRVDLQLVAELGAIAGDERDEAYPTLPAGAVPSDWLTRRCMGTATAPSLSFADVAHSDSLAHLRQHLAARLLHYGRDDFDAGDVRSRAPRALTQELSRYVYEHGGAPNGSGFAGVRYLSRLGDDVENWALFEGYELDEIVEADATITGDDPDVLQALETLGLVLGGAA